MNLRGDFLDQQYICPLKIHVFSRIFSLHHGLINQLFQVSREGSGRGMKTPRKKLRSDKPIETIEPFLGISIRPFGIIIRPFWGFIRYIYRGFRMPMHKKNIRPKEARPNLLNISLLRALFGLRCGISGSVVRDYCLTDGSMRGLEISTIKVNHSWR